MPAAAIYLYRHMQTAWSEVVAPWLASDDRTLGRSYIVLPTRGQVHAFKQHCLALKIALLGVELLTPGLARRKWAHYTAAPSAGTPSAPAAKSLGREFLLAGLRAIIEHRLDPPPANQTETGILKTLRTDCENALNDLDELHKAGFSAADFPDATVRGVFVELENWVASLGCDFAPRQTLAFAKTNTRLTQPGRVLIHGFSAEQRNEFFNLIAFARCFNDVTVTIPEPEFLRPKSADKPEADEAWTHLWETALATEAGRIEYTDAPPSCENVAEIWASTVTDGAYGFEPPSPAQTDLLVGITRADEMELVARKIAALLNDGAENIGVIFPTSDAAHLRLVDLLVARGIPFVDQLETIGAPPDIIQAQRTLLAFYENGCRIEELFALWPKSER